MHGANGARQAVVGNIGHIDRGYEDYVGKLAKIGANIRRVKASEL